MSAKKSYKDLQVWQKAVDFAERIYNETEGSGRRSDKEFRQFVVISRGSITELQTQMLIAMRVGYLKKDTYVSLSKELGEIGKMTFGLKRSLEPAYNL